MPYKSESGGKLTMCQVHTGAYVSLLAPEKADYTACHPGETTTYILHVATHTHVRLKSIGKKRNKAKKRKEEKGKERKEKKAKKERKEKKRKRKRKGKKRKGRKERQDKKRTQGKENRK